MRYRVTYGDIKSNILDTNSQLIWIKRDTKKAKKIIKRISPGVMTIQASPCFIILVHNIRCVDKRERSKNVKTSTIVTKLENNCENKCERIHKCDQIIYENLNKLIDFCENDCLLLIILLLLFEIEYVCVSCSP